MIFLFPPMCSKGKCLRQRLKRGAAAIDSLRSVMCFLNIRAFYSKTLIINLNINLFPLKCLKISLILLLSNENEYLLQTLQIDCIPLFLFYLFHIKSKF